MAKLKLTKEAQEQYINNPTVCIICDSARGLEWGELEGATETAVTQRMSCINCGAHWCNVYEIKGILTMEAATVEVEIE